MPDYGRWTSNGGDPSLNEINRSEKFIEALSLDRQVYATDHQEAELAQLLSAWRDDARREPVPGIATRDAVVALNRGTGHGRPRLPLALVGSVAAAVLCLGGFGAAVYGSSPGDALYGLRGTVFGQQQVRDVHVELASSELAQVQQMIDEGQWQQAQEKLQTITTTVATVGDAQQKQQLVDQWQQLSVKVENRDPQATVPPDAPPVVLPDIPVPLDVTPTSESGVPVTTTTPTPSSTEVSPTSPSSSPSGPESSPTSAPSETSVPSSETSGTPPTSGETSPGETSPAPSSSPSATELPATTSSPQAELPPTSTSGVGAAEPEATSPAHTTVTVMPTVVPTNTVPTKTVPTNTAPANEATVPSGTEPTANAPDQQQSAPEQGRGSGASRQQQSAPVIDLPIVPGLTTTGGQR